jgi:hypothetical protein
MPETGETLVTFLTDAVEPQPERGEGLRVGHFVHLQPQPDGRTVEAWSAQLGRLGRLPPQEGEALAPQLQTRVLVAQVSALVPRPGRRGGTRIHIRVRGVAA